jgi:hypothetical protein
VAGLRILELRRKSGELIELEAMPALITASTPPAEAERLEREHSTILAEVAELRDLQTMQCQ